MAIHVFHGDKGGVGKSFAAAAFGEYLLGKGRQITIVESDARNADAGRYFDGAAVVKKIDLRQTDGWVEFLTLLHTDTSDDIIVSLPSGIGGVFTANAPRLLAAAGDLKRNITVWWLLSRTVDSVVLLAPVTAAFGTEPGVKIVALRNLHFGEAGKFRRWNDGKVRLSRTTCRRRRLAQIRLVRGTRAKASATRTRSTANSDLGYFCPSPRKVPTCINYDFSWRLSLLDAPPRDHL
jgi:hypothetical protein